MVLAGILRKFKKMLKKVLKKFVRLKKLSTFAVPFETSIKNEASKRSLKYIFPRSRKTTVEDRSNLLVVRTGGRV